MRINTPKMLPDTGVLFRKENEDCDAKSSHISSDFPRCIPCSSAELSAQRTDLPRQHPCCSGRARAGLPPASASHSVLNDVKQGWSWRLGLITFNYNNCCLSPVFCIFPWGNLSALLFQPAPASPYRLDRSGPGPRSDASRRINANRSIDWEEQECSSFGGGRFSFK